MLVITLRVLHVRDSGYLIDDCPSLLKEWAFAGRCFPLSGIIIKELSKALVPGFSVIARVLMPRRFAIAEIAVPRKRTGQRHTELILRSIPRMAQGISPQNARMSPY